jgi:hypothetical protein
MEFFTFEASDFQVLEDIEFDEAIQRPEAIRFYTATEQTADAYEKMVPVGKVTRFQREEVRKEIDRLKDLYEFFVVPTADDYRLREPDFGRSFPWIHPVFPEPGYRGYDVDAQLVPLYDNTRLPGYYPRLIAALPSPYGDTSEGVAHPVTEPIEFYDRTATLRQRVLPEYMMTRTQRHEDKTVDILRVPVEGSEDVKKSIGYYLDKRPLDIPNPFPDHPFLKANEAGFVETTAPLKDVLPSLDAILTHGVPVTRDPYGEALPFLKLYDITLQDIPWSAWKSKFPPVDVVNEAPAGEPLVFPAPAQLSPPENVVDAYKTSYSPGVSVRLWLMNQMDGGGLIPELLRSQVIDNGSVESVPGVDLETASYPTTTLEECTLVGKNFQDFLIAGNLRRTWTMNKDKNVIKLQCVPLEFVKQERARAGFLGRQPWLETTGDDMKKAYVRRLEDIRPLEMKKQPIAPAEQTPARPDSIRRTEVLAVLNDVRRFADDKVRDINELLRETTLTNRVYSDPDGAFVCCSHTLAILGGELERDRTAFYETWTARVDGFRVCTFCGEQINTDVFLDQAEFDDDGFLIKRAEAFEGQIFHGVGVKSFTAGIGSLRPMFVLDNPHDDMVLLLLTVLQVLPTADRLDQLLKFGRTVATAQFSKGTADQVAKFTGITGIATTALLLQTHIPTLVPRRSFGTRPLILSGYPRDSPTPGEYTIADTLGMVLRKTFEAFPTSFKGPAQQAIRGVLNKPGEIKTIVVNLLSEKSPLIKGLKDVPSPVSGLMDAARAHHATEPVRVEQPKTLIPVLPAPKELGVINSFDGCPSSRPVWTSGRVPPVLQAGVPLRPAIQSAQSARAVPPSPSVRIVPTVTPKEEIRARLAKEKGLQTRIPISDGYVTNTTLASHLSDMFRLNEPVRAVDPTESIGTLRDISRGLLAETLSQIQKDPAKRAKLEEVRSKDVALYTLTANYTEERASVNRLVAAERMRFVQRMAEKSDAERQVTQDLLAIGLAPYVMTRKDREEFAQEAERIREQVYRDELRMTTEDPDVGVGQPRDVGDQGDEPPAGVDHGDYGDYVGDGDDGEFQQPQTGDDPASSI